MITLFSVALKTLSFISILWLMWNIFFTIVVRYITWLEAAQIFTGLYLLIYSFSFLYK